MTVPDILTALTDIGLAGAIGLGALLYFTGRAYKKFRG
jgi:hypothetical protein